MSVSIIMPVKNAARYLAECLDSIINQDLKRWELIAVDDHSTDDSLRILENYSSTDPRIKIFQNPGRGILPALTLALGYAQYTFITRMDADDIMPNHRLRSMKELLEASKAKTVVTGLVRYFPEKEVSEGYLNYESWINEINLKGTQWNNIYRECVIASPNWMVRRRELLEIGGFNQLIYPEDYHLAFRWYRNEFNIEVIPDITLHWREHPGRTSRRSEHYNQHAFFWLKVNEFLSQDYSTDQLVIWGNNQKTQLTKRVLFSNEIPWIEMNLTNYKKIEQLRNPQLLIGVYPPAGKRKKISSYLEQIGLNEGEHFWYI